MFKLCVTKRRTRASAYSRVEGATFLALACRIFLRQKKSLPNNGEGEEKAPGPPSERYLDPATLFARR